MQDRHWLELKTRIGFVKPPENEFTFTRVLDMGLM